VISPSTSLQEHISDDDDAVYLVSDAELDVSTDVLQLESSTDHLSRHVPVLGKLTIGLHYFINSSHGNGESSRLKLLLIFLQAFHPFYIEPTSTASEHGCTKS